MPFGEFPHYFFRFTFKLNPLNVPWPKISKGYALHPLNKGLKKSQDIKDGCFFSLVFNYRVGTLRLIHAFCNKSPVLKLFNKMGRV